jgi:hypothetical protein
METSEKISIEALLPVAKDLFLQCFVNNSPLGKLTKGTTPSDELTERVTSEFAKFFHLLQSKLTGQGQVEP